METGLQNGLMAAGYALLFFWLFTSPLRSTLRLMLFGCAFATVYNVLYDSAIQSRTATAIALFVRMLPPIEACWLVVGSRRDCHFAFICLLGAVALGCTSPSELAWGYLPVRHLLTFSVTCVCLLVWFTAKSLIVETTRELSMHLTLQLVWMSIHSLFSVLSPLYLDDWFKRAIARWIYVLSALLVVAAYRRLIRRLTVY